MLTRRFVCPDGVRRAAAPHPAQLRQEGAWTRRARAVMPTSSSPNWASLVMAAGPEQHGSTSNDWRPDKFDLPPTVMGPGVRAGHEIQSPVNIYDPAATRALAFGVTPSPAWIARPVVEAIVGGPR